MSCASHDSTQCKMPAIGATSTSRVFRNICSEQIVLTRNFLDAFQAALLGFENKAVLLVKVDPHLGEEAVGDVVRQPRFDPVQEPGERRGQAEEDQEIGKGRPGLDRRDRQRAENADPDKGGDPADP